MRRLHRATLPLLAATFVVWFGISPSVKAQTKRETAGTCKDWLLLSDHPLSELPEAARTILRRAVRSNLEAIVHDSSMGLSETVVETVPLNAIEIARASTNDALYIVAWDDNSFGVNGFNWLVEVKAGSAVNLMSDHAASMASGFGVKVLGSSMEQYPEIMIPGKSYAEGGGAMAAPGCFQKVGRFYENTSCPAYCQDELNAQ